MYVLTGKFTWKQIQNQLAGVAWFASKHALAEEVKAAPCGLAQGDIEFHLVTDMESEMIYICLHTNGVCIQHSKEPSALAQQVFDALRGHLVAAPPRS